jgi:23S rRNA (guanosine2251-2'-O)-methyltransferase
MKPPHTRRPGASGPGKSATGPFASGRGGDAPHSGKPHAGKSHVGKSHVGKSHIGKAGGWQQRGQAANAQPERPRTERTLTFRPTGDQPAGQREPGEPPRGPRPHAGPAGGPRPRRSPSPAPDPDAPRGALWLYGTHAVAAALANPARRLRRLLATEEAEAALAARRPPPWPIGVERADRARLDQLLGRDVAHQGTALLADPLAPPPLAAVLERRGPLLVLDQVADPRNVGAILRAGAAFGIAGVIVQDRNSPEETGALAKAASGALETVPLLRAVNLARTLVALKAAGCWVVGLDAGGASLSGPALAERRVALVLGNEGDGLRRLTRDTCDEVAGIAMPGGMQGGMQGGGHGLDSLNVSAAAAVALYELGRRP